MIISHPDSDITLVGFGRAPGNLPASGGDPNGNAAVWVMVRGHMTMHKVTVSASAVVDELVGRNPEVCSVTVHDAEQQAFVRRRHLYVARNGDSSFTDMNEAAETERTPLSARSLFGYDAPSGKLYLAESNQSANLAAVGWSQVLVRGMETCVCAPGFSSELAFVLSGIGAPRREVGRGLCVCEDPDDREKVACLLSIIRAGGHQHADEILFCMSQMPNLRGLGASAVALL
jgi:hypothetical protein